MGYMFCDLCVSLNNPSSGGGGGRICLVIFDLDLGVTQNITRFPLHHVTYAPEVAMSNGLGGDKFTRKHIL